MAKRITWVHRVFAILQSQEMETHGFYRVKLMMAHPHRSPELLAVNGQRFERSAAHTSTAGSDTIFMTDDCYKEVGSNELQAEKIDFEREEHEEPVENEDWHHLARMLPDWPLDLAGETSM